MSGTEAVSLATLVIALGTQLMLRSRRFTPTPERASDPRNSENARLVWGFRAWLESEFTFRRFLKWLWGLQAAVLFLIAFSGAAEQYWAFKKDAVAKYLLPPYHGIGWFAGYAGAHFYGAFFAALISSFLGWHAAVRLNRRFEERFFAPEEPLLLAIGILACGYPLLFFYAAAFMICGVVYVGFYQAIKKERAPLYFLWLPVAIVVILIGHRFLPADMLWQFNL